MSYLMKYRGSRIKRHGQGRCISVQTGHLVNRLNAGYEDGRGRIAPYPVCYGELLFNISTYLIQKTGNQQVTKHHKIEKFTCHMEKFGIY